MITKFINSLYKKHSGNNESLKFTEINLREQSEEKKHLDDPLEIKRKKLSI